MQEVRLDRTAKIVRNAIIVGVCIAFIFMLFHFFSGNYIGDRLEGTWRAVCIRDEITFEGTSFIRGREAGEFRIRANMIYFCTKCTGYTIRVTENHLWINSILYFRV